MSCITIAGTRQAVIAVAGTVCGFVSAVPVAIESGMPIGLLLALTYTV